MKVFLFKAVRNEEDVYKTFLHPVKPKGIYFAPSETTVLSWAKILKKPKIAIVEIPPVLFNLEVIGAVDGFYTEKGTQYLCKYKVDKLINLHRKLKRGTKRVRLVTGEITEVPSLPEIIIPPRNADIFKDLSRVVGVLSVEKLREKLSYDPFSPLSG